MYFYNWTLSPSAGYLEHLDLPCVQPSNDHLQAPFVRVKSVVVQLGGGPRVVVSTAAFHARVRGSVPGLGGLKRNKIVSSPSTCES